MSISWLKFFFFLQTHADKKIADYPDGGGGG